MTEYVGAKGSSPLVEYWNNGILEYWSERIEMVDWSNVVKESKNVFNI